MLTSVPVPPGTTASPDVQVRTLVDTITGVCASPPADGAGRRALLAELDRAVDLIAAARGKVLLAEREDTRWRREGFASFEAWRAQSSRMGSREAAAQVESAQTLQAAPGLARAVDAGEVTGEHVKIIARARRRSAEVCQADLTRGAGKSELMELARSHDAQAFAKATDRWLATQDPVKADAEHEDARRRRFLALSETPTGTHIKGFLDPVAGHMVRLALEAATPTPAADDERDFTQRNADALVDLAQLALNSGELKAGALVRPHVSLIITEETWAGVHGELRRRAAQAAAGTQTLDDAMNGSGGRPVPAPAPFAPVTLEGGTAVPLTEVATTLCDCEITRVALDAGGVPVDLGRTQRSFSREQRRAVIARDRHCQHPGCAQQARFCQIHHIDWWERDHGPTAISNGILLCSFHHHEIHRNNTAITTAAAAPNSPPGHGPPAPRFRFHSNGPEIGIVRQKYATP